MKRIVLGAALALAACNKSDGSKADNEVSKALSAIVATCAQAFGAVEVRRPGAAFWEPIKVGDVLHSGDWVKTGKGAYAKVAFLTGGGLELEENAVVVVDVAK